MATNLVLNQRTLLGSTSVKATYTKTTTYPDGSATHSKYTVSSAFILELYATLTAQSIANNTSTIKFEHVIKANGGCSYGSYSNARSIIAVGGADVSSLSVPNLNYAGAAATITNTYTNTYTHGSNGKLGGLTVSGRWRSTATDSDSGYTGTGPAPANSTLGNYTIDVPDITRTCALSVSKTTLGSSDSTTISTSNSSGLYVSCVIKYGSNTATLFSGTNTSYSVTKAKSALGAGITADSSGSATITLTTKTSSSGTTIGTDVVTIYLQGPGIPLSLYQNGSSVGASIGAEASGPGFYVNGIGPFTLKTITVGGVTYQVLAL